MQPTRDGPGALADVLDRLLDKGIVLSLDLIIGVANVPLIGINLRAAIAAVETLMEYGLLDGLGGGNRLAHPDKRGQP